MGKLRFAGSINNQSSKMDSQKRNFEKNIYFSDVCQFSHSDEECKVWNYMKENNSKYFFTT